MVHPAEGRKRFVITVLLCNLFSSLTVVFFSPMEVILGNQTEFFFPFLNAALIQGIAALLLAGLLTLIMVFLPRKIGLFLAALSLGGGLAAYLQGLFLNSQMVALTGEHMNVSSGEKITNLLIWLLVIGAAVAAIMLFSRKRQQTVTGVMCFVSAALLAMQSVAMIGTVATNGLEEKGDVLFLTSEGEFELSSGNNVIEIILDTADGTVVRQMLDRYPELYESLAGWEYYPNATSTHSRTFPSLTYLFSGKTCYYDLPVREYVSSAFAESPFLPGLKATGADICLYSSMTELLGPQMANYARNSLVYDYSQLSVLNPVRTVLNLMHVALYKSMPYVLKDRFAYDTGIINVSSFRDYERRDHPFMELDHLFHQDLLASGGLTSTDDYDSAFRLYHFWSMHVGYLWDENLEPTETEAEPVDALRGSFRNVETMIEEMKRLGVYDRATIIVVADHGLSNMGAEKLEIAQTYCPLLMVKYPNQDGTTPMKINEAPVAHEDLFATIEDALGAERSGCGSGKALREYAPEDERERIFYYTALHDSKDGEIVSREYRITGNAEDIENWHLTGRWWDVKYSYYRISKERFTGDASSEEAK